MLDFLDRFSGQENALQLPQEFSEYFTNTERWNAEVAKTYLEKNRDPVDEICSIALLDEHSVKGIDPFRLGYIDVNLVRACSKIFEIEARLAAERGDQTAALESMLALQRLANWATGPDNTEIFQHQRSERAT